jgi:hypothetical protein
MKFSDLFIPKIARSDPKVREQAVVKCKDVELLKRVELNRCAETHFTITSLHASI